MIAFLDGEVVSRGGDRLLLSVSGVGYELLVPATTVAKLPHTGAVTRVFTRLQVRDDTMLLYGFSSLEEREVFDHLVTVGGVGPKMALAILSVLAPEALRRAVATGDDAALTVVPGVGKKVAARIIVDLKDRLGAVASEPPVTGTLVEVREALLALGLSAQEARDALAAIPPDGDRPVEELLREALRSVRR